MFPALRLRVAVALALSGAALLIAGCGHPATAEECNAIIAKSAELELRAQNVTDPAVIAQRIEAVKTARGEELLKRCVGKRITERALACVGRAGSPKEVDACLE
jgi:predicted phosphoribosyltransferase